MTHKDHVELLKKAVPENSGGVWADIGSGDGAFTLALRDLAGPEVEIFSVERDRGRLESQKRNFQHEFPGTSIHFMRTGVEDILILPPLDGLIMANSLHYFEHKEQILNKIIKKVRHTRVGSDKGAKILAEFKLTSSINEEIVIKMEEIIYRIERIGRILKGRKRVPFQEQAL